MVNRIKRNINSHKIGYYIGSGYLLIIIASVFFDLIRYHQSTPAILPFFLMLVLLLLSFLWPLIFGIIFLVFGLFCIYVILASSFPLFAVIFLLPIILTGYFLIAEQNKKEVVSIR